MMNPIRAGTPAQLNNKVQKMKHAGTLQFAGVNPTSNRGAKHITS